MFFLDLRKGRERWLRLLRWDLRVKGSTDTAPQESRPHLTRLPPGLPQVFRLVKN